MKKLLIYISPWIGFLLIGCSGFKSNSSLRGSELEAHEVASSKVVAVISQNQILPNLQTCLGLSREQISNSTRTALQESIEGLAPEGEVDKISAPMLMSITKITAEVCNDLVNAEKAINESTASRKFFKGFNLANNNPGAGKEEDTVQRFAQACWGRLATEEELKIVKSSLNEVESIANKTNKDSALFICTAVLSSSQAIRF